MITKSRKEQLVRENASIRARPPGLLSFHLNISIDDREYVYSISAARGVVRYPQQAPGASHYLEELLYYNDSLGKIIVFTRQHEIAHIDLTNESISIGSAASTIVAANSLLPSDHPLQPIAQALRRFFSGVAYLPLDEPAAASQFVTSREYAEWKNIHDLTGHFGESVPMQLIYLSAERSEMLQDLKDRLGRKGLNLISDIAIKQHFMGMEEGQGDSWYNVRFFQTASGVSTPYSALSQGTRRIVRLLVAMAFGESPLLLIEHPEDGIHKGLARKIAGQLSTGGCTSQIVLSTHSDTLMNELDVSDIRFVSMEHGSTVIRGLNAEEKAAATGYINSDSEGTLAEFLHSMED